MSANAPTAEVKSIGIRRGSLCGGWWRRALDLQRSIGRHRATDLQGSTIPPRGARLRLRRGQGFGCRALGCAVLLPTGWGTRRMFVETMGGAVVGHDAGGFAVLPWLRPGRHAGFQIADDIVGDRLVAFGIAPAISYCSVHVIFLSNVGLACLAST